MTNGYSEKLIGAKVRNPELSTLNWGMGYPVVCSLEPGLPAETVGLKLFDIITHVNGIDIKGMNIDSSNDLYNLNSSNLITVKRIGHRESLNLLIPWMDIPSNSISEREFIAETYPMRESVLMWLPPTTEFNLNVHTDPEVDFYNYYTFDFEYSNYENPAQEKNLSLIIQSELENLGLKRDKENPDILIAFQYYSGKKEQYIPPSQQLTTRYKTAYNVWTKQYETRQYVQSYETGNRTVTDYIMSLKVIFLDANKSRENTKLPPVIFQSEYETGGFGNPDLQNSIRLESFIGIVFGEMIGDNFPARLNRSRFYESRITMHKKPSIVLPNYNMTYFYTGIWYDKKVKEKINYVISGSPADNAGIKAGDMIQSMNEVKIKDWNKWLSYESFYDTASQTEKIVYKVKRNGKKMEFIVEPISLYFSY